MTTSPDIYAVTNNCQVKEHCPCGKTHRAGPVAIMESDAFLCPTCATLAAPTLAAAVDRLVDELDCLAADPRSAGYAWPVVEDAYALMDDGTLACGTEADTSRLHAAVALIENRRAERSPVNLEVVRP